MHTQAQAKLKAKGKKMVMDLVVFPTYRKYGMLTQYDPTRPEGAGKSDERGLGVYQDMNSWDMVSGLHLFTERRLNTDFSFFSFLRASGRSAEQRAWKRSRPWAPTSP